MAGRSEELERQRLAKLERIISRGLDPYPAHYKRTHTAAQAQALGAEPEGEAGASPSISIAGRITAFRAMGKATFLDLRDSTGRIQVYLKRDVLGEERYELLRELDLGDFLGVTGRLFRTRTGEITVEASDFTILAKSLRPLPEKWLGLPDVETRYRQRYLDLIANEDARRIFLLRSRVVSAIRRFLDGRGFTEVETPVLQPQAGGAMARPFRSLYNALDRDVYL
ncbi:MAG: lysine--tRNA ligase, partial [Chloroflexi bacterium]|nr:lysine--tRNA ligase [Chloroflexota bacterium]